MIQELPEHSPLGGSSMARVIKCPGSVGLGAGLVDEESEHAALGTAAHAVGEECLKSNNDAWTYIGSQIEGAPVDKPMADAVQVYLDAVRKAHPDRNQGNFFIERPFYCPTIHKLMYGRGDAIYHDAPARALHVWDYKHGAGIVVDAPWNVQGMYYACGELESLGLWNDVDTVVIHIAQPRGFHFMGPVRDWSISVDDLLDWMLGVLVPAMERAMVSRDTASGPHCRFCPARGYDCPQLEKDRIELEQLMAILTDAKDAKGKPIKSAGLLTNDQVARLMDLGDVLKIAITAASKTAFQRLNAGNAVGDYKLAKARSNRVWKPEAEAALKKKFGADAMTAPKLKSPAEVEEMPEGESMCAQYAFKPDNGLTVVKGDDNRPAVSKDTKSMFIAANKARKKA